MKIDKAEIERIIDDFETKRDKLEEKDKLWPEHLRQHYKETETFDYCIAILRRVLHD